MYLGLWTAIMPRTYALFAMVVSGGGVSRQLQRWRRRRAQRSANVIVVRIVVAQ